MTLRLVSSRPARATRADTHALAHQTFCMAWFRMMGLRDIADRRCHDDVARTLLLSAIAQLVLKGEHDPREIAREALGYLAVCRND
jgi:hypothetical protein